MTAVQLPMSTLSQTLWPATPSLSFVRQAILAITGSLLLWVSAKIQVPLWPVPMTMQTYVILTLAAFMGRRLAVATILLYVLEGLAGLPVFASGAGPAYLMGPTGGYLVGFLLAAYVVGYMAERGWDRKILPALLMMTAGHVIIFISGLTWLIILNPKALGLVDSLTFAYQVGLQPFWLATILKTTLAMLTMPFLWQLVKSRKISS
ncbi:MAG: biotin transporter BioY [Rhodospirillaceae bacterium]|nr:biotin transporter BioY [Rhodospirillaceae bacterium]